MNHHLHELLKIRRVCIQHCLVSHVLQTERHQLNLRANNSIFTFFLNVCLLYHNELLNHELKYNTYCSELVLQWFFKIHWQGDITVETEERKPKKYRVKFLLSWQRHQHHKRRELHSQIRKLFEPMTAPSGTSDTGWLATCKMHWQTHARRGKTEL